MSYNFYVLEGRKLIDYKPKAEHYARAVQRHVNKIEEMFTTETFQDVKVKYPSEIDKTLFLLIKMLGKKDGEINRNDEALVFRYFSTISLISNLVGLYTPREFMRLFPIQKDYDGEKFGCKDYFYCMERINDFGIDQPIGDRAPEFLMDYWNWDINFYMVTWMNVVSAMHFIQTGGDMLLEFFEEQGIHPHIMVKDGDYMVDEETGERFKIQQPKNQLRKLFSVVD